MAAQMIIHANVVDNYKMKNIMRIETILFISLFFVCTFLKTYGQELELYQVKQDYPKFTEAPYDTFCFCCYMPTQADLINGALINESDIEYFDWTSQEVKLSKNGMEKLIRVDIPLKGLPVTFTINGEPIYGFWLWNIVSSDGCDGVTAVVNPKSTSIHLS
jgi:hypothetical protein